MTDVLLVAGGTDRQIDIFSMSRAVEQKKMEGTHANCIIFTDDKRFFIVGGFKLITIFKRDIHESILRYPVHEGNVTCMIYLGDGTLLTGSDDKKIFMWKLQLNPVAAPKKLIMKQFESEVTSMARHPTEPWTIYISCQNGDIFQWKIKWTTESDNIIKFKSGPDMIRSLTTAPTAQILVAAGNSGHVYIFSLEPIALLKDFEAHTKFINKCLLSADGTLLATCSADHTAKVWDMTRLESVQLKWKNVIHHARWVWDCAFTRDGRSLITVSSDRFVLQWFEGMSASRTLIERQRPALCVALAEDD
ncbi:putative LST8-required for transport of permease from the to the plasma membrane-like protein [Monocercomonoides exilis]|uniref:putative LST8-required for transport of permease from the to the plasma membrane-like protein n=1 Tax=Monocercomonoides exilis TaxID=2049356 RepID=UPI0035596E16|nr:putative LST8-required for transport of permease from the to the plasma membrane-like protein [Monocercomonoides exilis]|eukprot:MONOS_484.1-p1 / transcript=MONOS_484.1 / gene=MONOS_484 / organism=Monocercomonoides_exilis_PA203 / gene_product=LST8-required for transport of permease from the to the plasma membrane-like protein / transcript_product=LST8-required for transport of permease from the to the plasma membrane-like protein / location=Mono_scaffold00007:276073-277362(+) / protein_length=304 / sequence_SO=supercontig / SO=protein_coding / is_pseudo=false